MRKSLGLGLGLGLGAAAVIATALTPAAGWAAVTSPAVQTSTLSGPAGADPDTTVTFTVSNGVLGMTAPTAVDLGSGAPGSTVTGVLGTVTVTDNRALLAATWTATASSTDFTTGTGTTNEIIPSETTTYTPGTITTTGTITATGHVITLTAASQTTVSATAGVGDNSATWDPTLAVVLPAAAVSGLYTGTLTQSAA